MVDMLLLVAPFLIYSAPLEHIAQAEVIERIAEMMPNNTASPDEEFKKGKTVILREARFSGNDAITTEELTRLANPYLHQPFSKKDLRELEGRIKVVYKGRGYKNVGLTSSIEKHYDHYVLFITVKEGQRNPARQR